MQLSIKLRLVTIVLAIFALTYANDALAQVLAGSVSTITGDVHIERSGTTVPATPGMPLDVRDRIVTGHNSRVTITLTDNSKLELDQDTSLVIDDQMATTKAHKTKLSLFSGLVRSFVSYTSSPGTNFDVHTPNAVASARGTEFDTETDTKERTEYKGCRRFTQVSVYEGVIELINATNPSAGSVKVSAGHKSLVVCGFAPLPPSPMAAAAVATAPTTTTMASVLTSKTAIAVGGSVFVGGALSGGVVAGTSGGGTTTSPTVAKISPKH